MPMPTLGEEVTSLIERSHHGSWKNNKCAKTQIPGVRKLKLPHLNLIAVKVTKFPTLRNSTGLNLPGTSDPGRTPTRSPSTQVNTSKIGTMLFHYRLSARSSAEFCYHLAYSSSNKPLPNLKRWPLDNPSRLITVQACKTIKTITMLLVVLDTFFEVLLVFVVALVLRWTICFNYIQQNTFWYSGVKDLTLRMPQWSWIGMKR